MIARLGDRHSAVGEPLAERFLELSGDFGVLEHLGVGAAEFFDKVLAGLVSRGALRGGDLNVVRAIVGCHAVPCGFGGGAAEKPAAAGAATT
jgi:hypothetical protein